MLTYSMLISIGASAIALIYGSILIRVILKKSTGNKKMVDVANAISEGAKTFLNRQYSSLGLVAIVLFVALLYGLGWKIALGFLIGAFLSAAAGYIGMNLSIRANIRTAEASKTGIKEGMNVAFKSGTITGMFVAGLALLSVAGFYAIFKDMDALIGLGFGGSLISIFARLGGGIFTKGADVGADLVGKVETGIPEDDPRNPAVIADNVGDNVGDCAGMAADLFETYAVTTVAAMLLGQIIFTASPNALYLPLVIGGTSIITSIIGTFCVRLLRKSKNVMAALYQGLIVAGLLSAGLFYPIIAWMMRDNGQYSVVRLYCAAIIGLVVTLAMVLITEYFTSSRFAPVQSIVKSSLTGHGTNIITGLAVSMKATVAPVFVIAAAVLGTYTLAGLYGVALAAMSMLSLAGIIIALDAFGPVVDNAGGIIAMANQDGEARKNTDVLDSVGNTTKAVTKGYAIASAGLASLVLFSSFTEKFVNSGQTLTFDLTNPYVLIGLFIGGMLPYLFAALAMEAVGKAGSAIVVEVRRQFKEIHGILEGKTRPDYKRAVDIVTKSALRSMALPSMIVVLTPILVGLLLGPVALGGTLIGTIVTGVFVAISMTSGGGAWDNAKKYIESQELGKDSVIYKSAVTGDTVGDPYKDTAGPAINPIIKVVNIVALLITPIIINYKVTTLVKLIICGVLILILAAWAIFGNSRKNRK